MHRKGIYVIYDSKAQDIVSLPRLHQHEAAAIREFQNLVLGQDSPLRLNADDFTLEYLGTLDVMQLELQPDHRLIISARTVLNTMEAQH